MILPIMLREYGLCETGQYSTALELFLLITILPYPPSSPTVGRLGTGGRLPLSKSWDSLRALDKQREPTRDHTLPRRYPSWSASSNQPRILSSSVSKATGSVDFSIQTNKKRFDEGEKRSFQQLGDDSSLIATNLPFIMVTYSTFFKIFEAYGGLQSAGR